LRKRLTPVRGTEERPLAARWFIAHHTGRTPETVARHCTPVACDVQNRSLLYDVLASLAILDVLRRHVRANDLAGPYT
jgi:hypothetical protein